MKKPNEKTNAPAVIKEPCVENESCKAITFAQQRTILKEIEIPKYLHFFVFCCCTGTRVCEALSVKTKNIDCKRHLIRIDLPDSKTKKHKRVIPYLPELFQEMDLSGKYLFSEVTDDGSEQYFCKLYKRLEFDLSRHSARHTFISVCRHIGIAEELVMQWAGHTNLRMTNDVYTHELDNGSSPLLDYLKKLKKSLGL